MAYEDVPHLRAYLGLSGTTWDTFLAAGITAASVLADQWSHRNFSGITPGFGFFRKKFTQRFYLGGDEGVLLRVWPVSNFIGVTHGDDTALTEGTDFVYDSAMDDGWVQFIDDSNKLPLPRWNKVEVTYEAGYTEANLPASVRQFVRRAVSYWFQRRMQEGVGANLTGDMQITFRKSGELKDIFEETMGEFKLDIMQADDGVII